VNNGIQEPRNVLPRLTSVPDQNPEKVTVTLAIGHSGSRNPDCGQ
jgi:hypothetical protein